MCVNGSVVGINLFLSEIVHPVKCGTHDGKCLGKDTGTY